MHVIILLFMALLITANSILAADIIVTIDNNQCNATVDSKTYRCSMGKNGFSKDKREGDGKTPIGEFALRRIFYRPDKIAKNNLKHISLPLQEIKSSYGWCDDPKDKRYNTLIDLNNFNVASSHEKLYRDDDVYNLIIEVGYNDDPIIHDKGSAIFIHVAMPGYVGTAGCVAFAQNDLLEILQQLNKNSKLIVR